MWRNTKQPYGLTSTVINGNGGWAGVGFALGLPSANGQSYSIYGNGFTQAFGMSGLDQAIFQHEFAHTVYNSPHYFFANSVMGMRFYGTQGPGMMAYYKTHDAANAWERWYNGWIELQTGANHVNSDILLPSQLTPTNGEFTLRDFVTTGDAMRIRIPGSASQYLWLENHQHVSNFDDRANWLTNSWDYNPQPPLPYPTAPTGILAMVEDMQTSRTSPLPGGTYPSDTVGCNGLKVISAQGNFDYTPSTTSSDYNNYHYYHPIFDFTNPTANPFGGENQITDRRLDGENLNGVMTPDNLIYNNRDGGNGSPRHDEHYYSLRSNGTWENGMFGPNVEFNTVGQKMGIAHNPAIAEHQRYDRTNSKLSALHLNGLSVELISKNSSGDITVKVRYDDVDVARTTRWSGDLVMTNVLNTASGADVHVTSGGVLTINKSGTNNRETKVAGEFINPTTLTCAGPGIQFLQDGASTVSVEGDKTAFVVKNGGELKLGAGGATFTVKTGALLDIQSTGVYTGAAGTKLRITPGGSLVVRSGGKLQGTGGRIEVQAGAYLCLEAGADLGDVVLDVAPGAIVGTNPALGLPALNCRTQLQFCGRLTGNNPDLSAICPTGPEALLFDGNDDVVTIPYVSGAPLNSLGQTFTIEATIRADYTTGYTQTLFTNRYTDASYNVKGVSFTLYNGHYLLCQLEGQNYYSLSDPGMSLPAGGCHHVAVSHDAANQLHFYIDGVAAAYAPTTTRSAASTANVSFGSDPNFPLEGFYGQLGELRVWNTARSAADLLALQAAGLTSPQAGLVGYYDLRGTGGQDVSDWSSASAGGVANALGYLGASTLVEASDPAWVLGANLTCNVKGNFRSAGTRPLAPDTTGQHGRAVAGNTRGSSSTEHLSQLTISPNPASGEALMHFQLRDAGSVEVRIEDMTGLPRALALPLAKLEAGAHDVRLPLHELRPGLYLVIVTSADGRSVVRLEVK
ncbi:LamG-like jellyroll fold domain-containing protein [Hymenobacter ruricola]|uniref:LamG-like jellyroll fold domain-containing protein n=1 Tax=Hymenobacter ruricola TaxID=2791023 RepID=A0ABS0IAF5_9BACT|nr:LamG-like jellyroll fold domain-containing protein [Hymenobacter ruricola]MBF9223943.1 hypothetical protein [Hymenobacter ruricola]